MSRINLNGLDRRAVARARAYLAQLQETGVGPMDESQLCRTIGALEAHLDILLLVLDGGEER